LWRVWLDFLKTLISQLDPVCVKTHFRCADLFLEWLTIRCDRLWETLNACCRVDKTAFELLPTQDGHLVLTFIYLALRRQLYFDLELWNVLSRAIYHICIFFMQRQALFTRLEDSNSLRKVVLRFLLFFLR
jgi:hypothetical protein